MTPTHVPGHLVKAGLLHLTCQPALLVQIGQL